MVKQYYTIVEEFDSKKDYGIPMRKQYTQVLATLKKGEKVNPLEFTEKHLNEFTTKLRLRKTNRDIIYHSFSIGKKIGIMKEVTPQEKGIALEKEKFLALETIQYCLRQLRGSRYKNVTPTNPSGTASVYGYRLWQFNNWLSGKSFEFFTQIQVSADTFRCEKRIVKIQNIEHLLKMYQEPFSVKSDFSRIIKKYLLDPMHEGKRASTVNLDCCAIRAYFDRNDSPLDFKFDPKTNYKTQNGEDEQPSLSLDELMALLTVGRPNLTQKAVFLCKFHRGLDTSTLIDRFNFQAWEQLVEYFGTENYSSWDLSKCPVPIRLTRMKTDFTHTGFLDVDAIEALKKYLDFRYKKTAVPMSKDQPLFLNSRGEPLTNNWIVNSLKKLVENAGLRKLLGGYRDNRYKINSHEFRDLLKSTLIDCGVRPDLADHYIGHKPKDSYEKQAILYPETLRQEFSKSSKRINVFSNFSNIVKGYENTEEMREEIKNLREEQKIYIQTQKTMLEVLKQKQIIP